MHALQLHGVWTGWTLNDVDLGKGRRRRPAALVGDLRCLRAPDPRVEDQDALKELVRFADVLLGVKWLWVKICTQNGTLVSGNMNQNLRSPGGFIWTHTQMGVLPAGWKQGKPRSQTEKQRIVSLEPPKLER